MASERCAKCDATMGTEHRYGCPSATAPAPREAGAILTREAIEDLIDRDGSCEPWEYRILAHDAALRARVEELEKMLDGYTFEDGIRHYPISRTGKHDPLVCVGCLSAAESERDRLAEALREIAESCCYLDTDYKAIAAAALKREEKP